MWRFLIFLCCGLFALIGCSKSAPPQTVVEADSPDAAPDEPTESPMESWVRWMRDKQHPEAQQKAINELVKLHQETDEDPFPLLIGALDHRGTHGLGSHFPGEPGSTREAVVMTLFELGPDAEEVLDTQVLPKLQAGLSDPDPAVREHTIYAIGLLEDRAKPTMADLAKLTADDTQEVRTAAYRVLEQLGPDLETSETIARNLTHDDPMARRDAAVALRRIEPTPSMIDTLVAGLEDESQVVRQGAAQTLGRLGRQAQPAINELLNLVREEAERIDLTSGDPVSADTTPLEALMRIGEPSVMVLIPLLKDPHPMLRWWAALALRGIGPDAKAALSALNEAMKSPMEQYADVAFAAAVAQVTIGDDPKEPVKFVSDLLDHREPAIRAGAVQALGAMGESAGEAVPELVKAMKDENELVRTAAIESLRNLGPDAARAVDSLVPTLSVMLSSENLDISRAAVEILNRMGPAAERAVEDLGKAAADSDRDRDVRRMAAETLAALGPKAADAMEDLITALGDTRALPDIRAAFADALGRIQAEPEPVVTALVAAMKEKDPTVSAAAIRALGQLGESAVSAVPSLTEIAKSGYSMRIQAAAYESLARIGPGAKAALPTLESVLEKRIGDPRRIWAAVAVAKVKPDEAGRGVAIILEEMKEARRRGFEQDQVQVLRALREIGEPARSALQVVRDALRSEQASVRIQAIDTLVALAGPTPETARELASVLTSDEDTDVRRAAIVKLGQIGKAAEAAGPRLRELARTESALRTDAEQALREFEEEE